LPGGLEHLQHDALQFAEEGAEALVAIGGRGRG
jgi:hypothetical protein